MERGLAMEFKGLSKEDLRSLLPKIAKHLNDTTNLTWKVIPFRIVATNLPKHIDFYISVFAYGLFQDYQGYYLSLVFHNTKDMFGQRGKFETLDELDQDVSLVIKKYLSEIDQGFKQLCLDL